MHAGGGGGVLIGRAAAVLSPAPDRVFVSYSRSDERAVHAFARFLRAANVHVFLDVDDLAYGAKWKDEIRAALEQSTSIFVFWSRAAATSEQVRAEYEIACALHTGIRVIPILMDVTPLPEPLAGYNGLPLQFVLAQTGVVHGARHGAALFSGAVVTAFAVGAAVGPLQIAERYVHHPPSDVVVKTPAPARPDGGVQVATAGRIHTTEAPDGMRIQPGLGSLGHDTGKGFGMGEGNLTGPRDRAEPPFTEAESRTVPHPEAQRRQPQTRIHRTRVIVDALLLLFPFGLIGTWFLWRRRAARRKLARIVAEAAAR